MSSTRVIIEEKCSEGACNAKYQASAEISARIGDGGSIEFRFTHSPPKGWKSQFGRMYCPDHEDYNK